MKKSSDTMKRKESWREILSNEDIIDKPAHKNNN